MRRAAYIVSHALLMIVVVDAATKLIKGGDFVLHLMFIAVLAAAVLLLRKRDTREQAIAPESRNPSDPAEWH